MLVGSLRVIIVLGRMGLDFFSLFAHEEYFVGVDFVDFAVVFED